MNALATVRSFRPKHSGIVSFKRFISQADVHLVPLPSLSPTMATGTIASWRKKAGESFKAGDVLCEVETDKAVVGFDAQDDGVIAKIIAEVGSELAVGSPIALTVEDMNTYNEFLDADISLYQALLNSNGSSPVAVVAVVDVPTMNQANFRLSPAARHLVESKHIDVSGISPSGKGGKILTKADILSSMTKSIPLAAISAASVAAPQPMSVPSAQSTPAPTISASPAPTATVNISTAPINSRYTDIPNSTIRKVIAKRLGESKATVPHFYTIVDCEIDQILSLRKQLKKEFDVNVSVNDLVIKSVAMALRDVPEINAKWNRASNAIDMGESIDISVAVATPTGLITPIVKNADKLGVSEISSRVKDLANRAKEGKLKPEEFQGGSFSISNLGMFGISSFSAVINPPQSCILAVGGGNPKLVPVTAADGKITLRTSTLMTVQLSGDRRVVDESLASQFLQVLRNYIAEPKRLLL